MEEKEEVSDPRLEASIVKHIIFGIEHAEFKQRMRNNPTQYVKLQSLEERADYLLRLENAGITDYWRD
jgi:hypothetical protein